MGQVYNRSKMDNVHDLMLEEVQNFVSVLQAKAGTCVELVTACRALEADIICKLRKLAVSILTHLLKHIPKPGSASVYR